VRCCACLQVGLLRSLVSESDPASFPLARLAVLYNGAEQLDKTPLKAIAGGHSGEKADPVLLTLLVRVGPALGSKPLRAHLDLD
jgi:hypothetical protein